MKFSAAVKYQMWDSRHPLMIFYGIIYAIYALTIVLATSSSVDVRMSGIELSSMIFIFVFGLNFFKESFQMFLQNGVSRSTVFKAMAVAIIPVAAFMAIIDTVNNALANLAANYEGMYLQLYHLRYSGAFGGGVQYIEGLLWYLTAYAMMGMLGLFITTLYYRMSKKLKLLVSIGVPVTLFVVLPVVERSFTNGAIFRGIGNFFAFAWGYENGYNPYFSMVTCTLFAALFAGLSWLLIRRAVVKE